MCNIANILTDPEKKLRFYKEIQRIDEEAIKNLYSLQDERRGWAQIGEDFLVRMERSFSAVIEPKLVAVMMAIQKLESEISPKE